MLGAFGSWASTVSTGLGMFQVLELLVHAGKLGVLERGHPTRGATGGAECT